MIKHDIIKILKENKIENIYYTGCFDMEDQDFIINSNYVYFKLGENFICFEAIESYSKLEISITDSIIYRNDIEDFIDGKVEISDLILKSILTDNKVVQEITFYNLFEKENSIITDVLACVINDKDYIFLDPGFLGIKVGGLEQKEFWEKNSNNNEKINIEEICI